MTVHTWFDTYHQTVSLCNISLCHHSAHMDGECEVLLDRLGSDHPIIITANTSDYPVPKRFPKWNFKKNGMLFIPMYYLNHQTVSLTNILKWKC